MNMYDIYSIEEIYRNRKEENKRICESNKKQIRSK